MYQILMYNNCLFRNTILLLIVYAYISFRHVYMLIDGIVNISAGTSQSILWMGYMQTSLRSSAHVRGHLKRIL